MRTSNDQLNFTNSGVMNTTITSQAILLDQMFGYSPQVTWTGSPVGNLSLQYSDDYGPGIQNDGKNVVNWTTDTTSTQPVAGINSFVWNTQYAMYRWVRVIYVPTSGSGNATGRINCKGP